MLDDFNKPKSSRRDFANMPVGRRHSYIKLEPRSVHSQPAAPLAMKKGRARPRLAMHGLAHSRLFAWPRRLSRFLAQKTHQLYRRSGLKRLTALYKRTRAGKFLRRFRLEYPLVLLILLSIFIPLWQSRQLANAYQLTAAEKSLVGNVNQSLSHRIDYDSSSKMYRFNHAAVKASAGGDKQNIINNLQTRVSSSDQKDAPLYAASMPLDISKGVSYYDTNLQQSFSLIPQFGAQAGKLVDGRLLYPLGGDSTAVYSVKNNGLKEDILLTRASSDVMTFSYQLKLPDTLEARMMPDGQNVGIYSADPSLYGDKAYGSKAAQAEAAQQRVNGPKNHLVFGIPAPVIKQSGGGSTKPAAKFILKDNSLTVFATGLKSASYPLTIDPSVVVTSTSDFGTGNDESDIDFPANQINRGGLTGGTLSGGWTSQTGGAVLSSATEGSSTVTYNGYIYEIGGYTTTTIPYVYYATISSGTVGSWTATTSLPVATYLATAVVYNGYIYLIGGYNTSSSTANVYYNAINSDGSLTPNWQLASTTLPSATYWSTSVVYNGRIYLIGGYTTTYTSAVYSTPINADGSLGSWTSTGMTALTTATDMATSVAYNGYIYLIGGNTGSVTANVYAAAVKSDGTLGSWNAVTALANATYSATSVVDNGYIYEIGGYTTGFSSTVSYAPINANGSLGSWTTTTALTTAVDNATSAVYGGYIYQIGGLTGSGSIANVYSAKIDPAGVVSSSTWGSYTSGTKALPKNTYKQSSVAYNGYLYSLGGHDGSGNYLSDVNYSQIQSDGSVGAWNPTTSLPVKMDYATAQAYNGYIYFIGGYDGTNTLQDGYYNTINSNGTLGATWTKQTNILAVKTMEASSVVYNGYFYVTGGYYVGTGASELRSVQIAAINSNGSLGSFTNSLSNQMPTTTTGAPAVVWNGYIYVIAGRNGGTVVNTVFWGQIKTDGTGNIVSWSTSSSPNLLSTGVYQAAAVVYNGYIYAVAGATAQTNTAAVTTVQYAPINSDGSPGVWTTTTSIPTASIYGTAVVYNGVIYQMGGQNTSSSTGMVNVNYAFLNNGGPGTLGTWYSGSSYNIPTATDIASSVAYNGYIYQIGGYTAGGPVATVTYAAINADGTLGSWYSGSSYNLPTATYIPNSVAYNGYLYVIGGINGSSTTVATVTYAPINANGSLGSWYTGSAYNLPTAINSSTSVAYNGYLYVIGGNNSGGTTVATVTYAPINANGSLGSWYTGSAYNLPTATDAATSVVYNGYIYEIGGYNSGGYTNTVYYAPIGSNGTLGSWTATTQLPTANDAATSVAYNGYLYVIGGTNGSSVFATVYYAPIGSNGTLGSWTATTQLPTATDSATSVVYNGYIYEIGGLNSVGTTLATVTYAPLNVMPRVGVYSKSFNFGSGIVPVSITYNGTLPNGANAISYELAGNNAVFGASQSAASLPGGTANQCGSGPPSNTPYMFVSITLDDSQSGTFPDVSGNNANITDFTINYNAGSHPPPNIRLRTGQTLQQSTGLSPLDTCYP